MQVVHKMASLGTANMGLSCGHMPHLACVAQVAFCRPLISVTEFYLNTEN